MNGAAVAADEPRTPTLQRPPKFSNTNTRSRRVIQRENAKRLHADE
jgi:hypothetical protein